MKILISFRQTQQKTAQQNYFDLIKLKKSNMPICRWERVWCLKISGPSCGESLGHAHCPGGRSGCLGCGQHSTQRTNKWCGHICRNSKSICEFIYGLFSICQNFKLTLANFDCCTYTANYYSTNNQVIWTHLREPFANHIKAFNFYSHRWVLQTSLWSSSRKEER